MALSIWLLGPPQVALDGQLITALRRNKALALLAHLAVESDRAHRREKLAGLLWPDHTESSARTNLRRALADLRQAIGDDQAAPPYLLTTRETIQFNTGSDYWLDVEAFANPPDDPAAVEQAIALYRGDFLEGLSLGDAALFEEWALLKKEHLERRLLGMLEHLATTYEQRGEYERAQHFARRRVEIEPLNEGAQRQVMRLLALGGERNAALARYEACRRVLAEELGVEPDRETTALYEAIRDGLLVAPAFITATPAFVSEEAQAGATPRPAFVGREHELARLDGFLDRALAGRGRVVLIIGEPGSGKTILAQEFVRRAIDAHPDLAAASGRCNAYTGIGDPYLPFLEILQMLTGDVEAGWAGGAIPRTHARRLWALMPEAVQALWEDGPELIDRFVPGGALLARARTGAPHEAGRLAELLERRAASGLGTANLKQVDLFEQYTKVLAALSHRHPLILVVDDLQWADVGSIGLLFHLGRRLAGSRILLVGAYRPGDVAMGRPATGGGSERHPLEPVIYEFQRDLGDIYVDLAQSEGRQFVEALLDSEPNCLDAGFREVLHRHTGGHPLFTVELLRSLRERAGLAQDGSGRWVVGPALDWEMLPPRVEAVIAERIGRLPEEWQSMLSAASVEGEEFTAEAVARVQGIDEAQVVHHLSGPLSQQHGLVLGQGVLRLGGQRLSRYRFRHFLFQKYLYSKLDPVRRTELHEAIGQALEALYAEQAVELALPLARHFAAAGMTARAAEYLLQAGNRAARLFANEEAIAHYRRGIELVGTLPDTPQRARMELALQLALGVPLIATRSFSGAETAQTYRRARELARSVEALPELFQALAGLVGYCDVHADLQESRRLGQEMLAVSQRLNDPGLLAMAHHHMSTALLYLGEVNGFIEQWERMRALYDAERDRSLAYRFGLDPQLSGLSHAGWAYWFLGHPDQAALRSEEAVSLTRELGHPYLLSWASMFAAFSAVYRRDIRSARRNAKQSIAISSEQGYPLWLGGGLASLGWVLGEEGEADKGIANILRALEVLRATESTLGYLQTLPLLAETYRKAGRASEGLHVVDEALALIGATECRMDEPEVHRLRGELLLMLGRDAEAETSLRKAIEVARRQAARSWELRATTSLARMWQAQGRIDEARCVLAATYGWFTEGFDTPDLREAQALLDEL